MKKRTFLLLLAIFAIAVLSIVLLPYLKFVDYGPLPSIKTIEFEKTIARPRIPCYFFRLDAGFIHDSALKNRVPPYILLWRQTIDNEPELVRWTYNIYSRIFTIEQYNVVLNCCGSFRTYITYENSSHTYIWNQIDMPNELFPRCDCLCTFKLKVELADIKEESMRLKIYRKIYMSGFNGIVCDKDLDFSKMCGVFTIPKKTPRDFL